MTAAAGAFNTSQFGMKPPTVSVSNMIPPKRFVSRYFPNSEGCFCAPVMQCSMIETCNPDDMVSRRKILSRSRDGLDSDFNPDDEDVWFLKEKLFKDHIQEVLNKYRQLDDDIWAKIVVMERNRRVAKAYARVQVLTINGSDDGFDGYRIGLCGFENPMRDAKTEALKKHIGHGVKIKMDKDGNIMVKRISKENVYVKEVKNERNSIGNDIVIAGGLLEIEKPSKLFDMKKFTYNVDRELKRAYPERRKLESQCISILSFVKDTPDLLDCSCWIMVINVKALGILRSEIPAMKRTTIERFDHRPVDEDPYSDLNLSDAMLQRYGDYSRDSMPPKLPPRDFKRSSVPQPDYEDWAHSNPSSRMHQQSGFKDDPYCCGMKARVPNFGKKPNAQLSAVYKSHSSGYLSLLRQSERSSFDNGRGRETFLNEGLPKHYGAPRTLTRPGSTGAMYIGEWE